MVYSLWHEVGFTTVVFLGGLATLSNELSEAARVDGCSAWQEFWHVTWHQLKPVTVFVIAITAITSLQAFTQFYQLANGGPAYATTTLSYLVYQEAFVLATPATARRWPWSCSPSPSSSPSSGAAPRPAATRTLSNLNPSHWFGLLNPYRHPTPRNRETEHPCASASPRPPAWPPSP